MRLEYRQNADPVNLQPKTGGSPLEFLAEYGMFLLRVATIVIAVIIVVGTIAASGSRHKKAGKKGTIKVTHVNDHIDEMRAALQHSVLDKEHLKQVHKLEKKEAKVEKKQAKAGMKQEKAGKKQEASSSSRTSPTRGPPTSPTSAT